MFQDGNNEIYQEASSKVNTNKAVGIDSIRPKLVKLAAEPLSQPVTEAINMCIKQNDFRNNAKVASVVPLNKGKPNKHDMSNFRPVCVLNTFSKIYEQVAKEQIVLGTENFLSPKITQTLLLHLSKTRGKISIKIS